MVCHFVSSRDNGMVAVPNTISEGCLRVLPSRFHAWRNLFFTVVTAERRPLLAEPATVTLLRGAFRTAMTHHPFQIDAIVVLPDHLHTIWTLPEGDSDYPRRWNRIKSLFTAGCPAHFRPIPPPRA